MKCLELFTVFILALFVNGDCFCTSEQSARFHGQLLGDDKRAALMYRQYLWPATYDSRHKVVKVVIPYTVKTGGWFSGLDDDDKQLIREAADVIAQHTCIRFVERTSQTDYIEFYSDKSGACQSNIGKKGGKQMLSLGSGCKSRGHVIHELMHALGFFHEQTRPDRDKFVRILWENIKKDQLDQFKTRTKYEATTFGQPYDFQSIMHYTNKEFSSNGKDTIQALSDPSMPLGNMNSPSAVDVLQINLLYNCPEAQKEAENYKVTVYTGSKFFAGTDARAFLELFGENAGRKENSGEVELAGQSNAFEKGHVDTFNVISPVLGKLTKLTIRHNDEGFAADWYLSKIRVQNLKRQEDFLFVCYCWLEGTPNTQTLTPVSPELMAFFLHM